MESQSKVDEPYPTTPLYPLPDERKSHQDVKIYYIHSPSSFPPPPPFSPGENGFNGDHSAFCMDTASSLYNKCGVFPSSPRPRFVCHETELFHSPGLTTCPFCETQVMTRVIYRIGKYAWLMCLLFVLCGLILGCCLIPLFVRFFKDAYHTCPHCQRVLHVYRKKCCR